MAVVPVKAEKVEDNPGKVYLFSYTNHEDRSRNGLYFAWSTDKVNWHAIGPEHPFLQSDYGAWGSQKKMVSPFLFKDQENLWHCIWSVNTTDFTFAHAASEDLVHWKRQSYPPLNTEKNILAPQIKFTGSLYEVQWKSKVGAEVTYHKVTTRDFKEYSKIEKASYDTTLKSEVVVDGMSFEGVITEVEWSEVQTLIDAKDLSVYKSKRYSETTQQDTKRFDGLANVTAQITIHKDRKKAISPLLMGIFFEDINYAADGGLYAELIQNRDFEYTPADTKFRDYTWNSLKAWKSEGIEVTIDSISPIHENNLHYVTIKRNDELGKLVNEGFDGIPLKANEKYYFSLFAKTFEGATKLKISLVDTLGKVYTTKTINATSKNWKKYQTTLKVKESARYTQLVIEPMSNQKVGLDFISLFPAETFKQHKNGLRADLAQTIADINPKFVRFPGGCVAHGDGLDNIYRWKNTIGPLETRKPQRNIWNYHQSMGLGYFEYFQFCEDINATPLPVIAAGVPCQNSSTGGAGQQCGIPEEEMVAYIQDILDLIEWANGDKNSEWGSKRAAAGHPEPFNLKYLGIGNEDLITDVFEERFTQIFNAIQKAYPEIVVIGTVGPFYEGTDYDEGWELANKLEVPMVDEHYYVPLGWLIHNQDYYDAYDRNNAKVYLGEYASHLPGRPSNMETALSEALYLTAVERNGDVVKMTSYAPLLAKENHTQWKPDLIYFNNLEVKPTTDYYVQKLYGQNAGTIYYDTDVSIPFANEDITNRVGVSVVQDEESGDMIIKLVSMLPVPVTANLDHTQFVMNSNATLTVFAGAPDAIDVIPTTEDFKIGKEFEYTLPPYSFTVIRVQTQQ
ncbi:alpha-L-arabinofuranosidase [Neptunitalea sp. Y10]|uniref:non-reducing end alpha-L-arabinofuranosidase n=1 Tax=Neptunitalea lumnitzerae TaxID=2965509 RepID=A0ABQ5MLY6_9FLAO|nr:alpha-L-arabinofuranosidase [Neptunitalea sp. Y10]